MSRYYPIKHWLTTLMIGPLLLGIYEAIRASDRNVWGELQTYPLFLVLGLVYSFPVFLMYCLAFNLLIKTTATPWLIKTILNTGAIACVFISFKIIGGSLALTLSIAYSMALLISSFFFKVQNHTKHSL
jgi:hypothetical protein